MLNRSVSVAIPCFDGADYVGQAIQSVLDQSHPADEVLVIDDGSADGSAALVRRYPVRLIEHGRNKGLACARNTAVECAEGEVLVFLDVDAVADPTLLVTLLSGYDCAAVGGVGGQGIESNIHSLADRWRKAHATQGHGIKPKDVEFLFGLCMSFRVDVLREVGGFNSAFRTNAEDMDIGLRIRAAGYRLRYLPSAKVYHQRTDDEISLRRAMANWYAAAYRAKRINGARPWKLFAGTLRRLASDPLTDLLLQRDVELARLSWRLGWTKLYALWRAARNP